MSDSTFEKVAAFHEKFDLPYLADGSDPNMPRLTQQEGIDLLHMRRAAVAIRDELRRNPDSRPHYRLAFIMEEVAELMTAVALNDLPAIADALADIDYVVAGTAHFYQIPHDVMVSEVHRSNLEKVPMQTERGSDTDVGKPKGWVGPDIAGLIKFFGVTFADG